MKKLAHISVGLLMLGTVASGQAKAAQELIVKTDQTQLITLSAMPGVAVVGNPSIADVTIKGQQVFVHGRAFGLTNLIILDPDGNQLASLDVTVQKATNNELVVFKAGSKLSYVCAPDCESTLQVGDQKDYFDMLNQQAGAKSGLATGSSAGGGGTTTGQPPVTN